MERCVCNGRDWNVPRFDLVFLEELGHIHGYGMPMAITVQTHMATPAIYEFGSDYLKKTYLKAAIAGDMAAAEATGETMLAEAKAEDDKAQMANIHQYWGDMMLDADEPAKAEEHFAAALELRQASTMNDANKQQAERTHLFKTAIAAMKAGDNEAAASRTAEI